jgi:hypothetical protein
MRLADGSAPTGQASLSMRERLTISLPTDHSDETEMVVGTNDRRSYGPGRIWERGTAIWVSWIH